MTPLGEVKMTPPLPTNTYCDKGPDQVTPKRCCDVKGGRAFQFCPSDDVSRVPANPAATNCDPDQAIPARPCEVGEDTNVHVTPSVEVRMVPPTATYRDPDQATLKRLAPDVPDVRTVHVVPGGGGVVGVGVGVKVAVGVGVRVAVG